MTASLRKEIKDYFSKRARYGITEFASKLIYVLVSLLVGWIVIVPLSKIIPRKKGRLLFIGRENGRFTDNVKYLYIGVKRLNLKEFELVFLTEDKEEHERLKRHSVKCVLHPSFASVKFLLTSHLHIVDHETWAFSFKYFLLFHAKRIQLWHGVGMKYIGLMKMHEEVKNSFFRNGLILLYKIIGLIPKYDLFISTSEFYTNEVFAKSYRADKFIEAGYPRNDILFMKPADIEAEELYSLNADNDCIKTAHRYKDEGCKLILYAPTFRDSGGDPLSDKAIDLQELNDFANGAQLIFIFKFHPDPFFAYSKQELSNVLWYANNLDVYPLLPMIDLLVTDYSAIFMDYLLLKRPIIFFPYDYDKFINKDRPLQFDYLSMTPGPRCFSQEELQKEINNILVASKDDYEAKREKIANLAFKYRDGNSAGRITDIIRGRVLN